MQYPIANLIAKGDGRLIYYQHVTVECPTSVRKGRLLMFLVDAGRRLGIHVQDLERVHDPCDDLMRAYAKLGAFRYGSACVYGSPGSWKCLNNTHAPALSTIGSHCEQNDEHES